MKIKEIIVEFDDTSKYGNEVQNELVNHLSSIAGTGITAPISVMKVAHYMRSLGFDVLPEQIDDILAGTGFEVNGETIEHTANPTELDPKAKSADIQGNKVSQMASKQLKRDI